MNGVELTDRVRACRPDLKVLVMSGYADDALILARPDGVPLPFLQKPVDRQTLTQKVRELLARTT